jgi:hypothetical protein
MNIDPLNLSPPERLSANTPLNVPELPLKGKGGNEEKDGTVKFTSQIEFTLQTRTGPPGQSGVCD